MLGTCSEDSESEAEAEEQQPRIPLEGFRRERRDDTPEPEEDDAPSTEDAKVKEIIAQITQRQSQESQEDMERRDALIDNAIEAGVDVLDLVCCTSQMLGALA